ncbi:MAG: putative lipid II flippase FtsW [Propionibacteriaceae bacterium]
MAILSSPLSQAASRKPGNPKKPGSTKKKAGSARGRSDERSAFGFLRTALGKPMTSYHLVLAASGLLLALGMMMVLSASSVYAYIHTGDSYYFVKRQVVFLIAGMGAAWFIAKSSPGRLRVLAWVGLAGSLVLLVLTYTPLGVNINGNRNWVEFGSSLFRLQPSEFAKLAMIIWSADVLARKYKLLDQPRHLLIPFLPVNALLILLVVFQGDVGTAVVMAGILVGMLWIIGAPLRIFVGLLIASGAGLVGMILTSPNRMERFVAFLNPAADQAGTNLQQTVAGYALASGGWWGLGLGGSRQKWGGLPEAHTDFVFAVIGEELGLFGSLSVLALFLVLGYTGIRIALRSDDNFSRYCAAGVTAWFLGQALINLGCVLRLLPVAGVPLPLVSYGGSALLANLLALGLLLACARNEPAARKVLGKGRKAKARMTTVVGSRRG